MSRVDEVRPVDPRVRRLDAVLADRGLEARRLNITPGHEPERLMDATRGQRSVVAHAKGMPWTAADSCAAWVEDVLVWSGLGREVGDARELYERHCTLSDPGELRVGMIVAVPSCPYSPAALRHGHVALYVGDGMVMDSADRGVRTVPLALWYEAYGVTAEPRWGWMRGIPLA
ncbi:MAG: hypothetical protein LKF00_00250 [Olsenella sp.]|jgi:hypothetical protein|nr:hypothetical protein [Olsenella sp.]MCI1289605.1 hypothetical protein [Olsenella sp.]